jgi:Kdo2-lipid IVA lauroyltransferase/acyltransferase
LSLHQFKCCSRAAAEGDRYASTFWLLKFMTKRGTVQTDLEYAIARFLISGLGLLPRTLAVSIGRTMGRIAYHLSRGLRLTGERNLELVFPEMSGDERKRILRGCFISLGRQLGEFSHFPAMNPATLRRILDCEGLENLEAARASGRGVILFTAHLGAWELLAYGLSCLGYPVSFLVRRLDNPKVERMIERIRTRSGNRVIDKRAAVRPMLKVIREGGLLGFLIDINMAAHEGIFVDFFGTSASTTFILAKLALQTEAAVIPCFAPWDEQRQRFVLDIGAPLKLEPTSDAEKDERQLTSELTKVIENYIRRYPDQWLWIHKRWRTRPDGEPDIYNNTA